MSAQKTHFADDATLAWISQLERENAALTARVAELERDAQRALVALEAMQMEARARSCGLKICDDSIEELRSALRGLEAGKASECPHGVPHRWPCDKCDVGLEAGEPVAWIGCGGCDCKFECHEGKERCIRLEPRDESNLVRVDAAPAGMVMVMVPRELEGKMLAEMWRAVNAHTGGHNHESLKCVWRRTLAAAAEGKR